MIELRVAPTINSDILLFDSTEDAQWAELKLKKPVKDILDQNQQKELGSLVMKALIDGLKQMGVIRAGDRGNLH